MEMNRVLLKLSGEALAGEKKQGFDEKTVYDVAGQVKKILDKGIQLCVVIGGGNFWRGRTSENMEQGEVVFFAGGIGHPYFSTDMATVLMAVEVKADVVLSAKAIDGVYDSDPKTNPNAKKYDSMQMKDIVDNKLGVIDLASAVLAMENKMPMMLFGLNGEDSIVKAVTGGFTGTYVNV